MTTSLLRINKKRLSESISTLAEIGSLPTGGVSRLALSDEDKRARDNLLVWMKELGLEIHIDQVGNIVGVRRGREQVPPVMLGSHIDSVIGAGRLDGCYGVLAALECIRIMNENNVDTLRPIAVAAFTNEEGVRYQPGMLGSAGYAGILPVEFIRSIVGSDGSNFGAELDRIGYAGTMKCGAIHPSVYLELHIEQGPILDREKIPLGVVEGVVGISWWEITITGEANHAGTTPMELRHDAGLSAAKIVSYIRQIAIELAGNQRATCGSIKFNPNAINVIPGKAILTIDLRNDDEEKLRIAEGMLEDYALSIEHEEGVDIQIRRLEKVPAVTFDKQAVTRIEAIADSLVIRHRRMISGAGHDAQLMAGYCPSAMIFVPSIGGISHSPEENTSIESLAEGANVLLHTALSFADSS